VYHHCVPRESRSARQALNASSALRSLIEFGPSVIRNVRFGWKADILYQTVDRRRLALIGADEAPLLEKFRALRDEHRLGD
jgi:hypothetical protein